MGTISFMPNSCLFLSHLDDFIINRNIIYILKSIEFIEHNLTAFIAINFDDINEIILYEYSILMRLNL